MPRIVARLTPRRLSELGARAYGPSALRPKGENARSPCAEHVGVLEVNEHLCEFFPCFFRWEVPIRAVILIVRVRVSRRKAWRRLGGWRSVPAVTSQAAAVASAENRLPEPLGRMAEET
eukprot:6774938-Alexandrium_andersonii.AAC.1